MKQLACLLVTAALCLVCVGAQAHAQDHTWRQVQSYFLDATGFGLVRIQHADADGLVIKDASSNGPVWKAFVKRFGYMAIDVYRSEPSECWRALAKRRGYGALGPVHWARERKNANVEIWLVTVLYGDVCVTSSVEGTSPSLPQSWFRMNAVMSKLH